MTELQEILDTMDIPEQRKTDWPWLWRNIGVRNSGHPLFMEAKLLLKEKIMAKSKLFEGDI